MQHKRGVAKLLISEQGIGIKLEVNMVGRGTLASSLTMPLCRKAQEEFEAFCAVPIVPVGQLYGGKICVALDRQHPRDLFDVKYLLENEVVEWKLRNLQKLKGSNPDKHRKQYEALRDSLDA